MFLGVQDLIINHFLCFRFRYLCYKLAVNKIFINFILALILLSSIALCLEDPLNRDVLRNTVSAILSSVVEREQRYFLQCYNVIGPFTIDIFSKKLNDLEYLDWD